MNVELILRISAVVIGAGILLTSVLNIESIVSWVLGLVTSDEKPVKTPEVPVVDEDEQFLKIVDLWFQLRNECEEYGLPKALVAIDKVFPLLNDKIEE